MTRRILITGGAGFIGSHLVKACVAAGYTVAVLDDFRTGRREYLPPGIQLYEVDICDAQAVQATLAEFHPQAVSHHAAQINVRQSVAAPGEDAGINIGGSLNLLEAILAAGGVEQLIFASTGGALYGDDAPRPTPEAEPPAPQSPYGIAKWTVEEYLRVLGALHGLPVTVLRYANVYGPRQIPEGEAGVVAIFCEALRAGRAPVIFGDGGQTRDYLYVEDVVAAHQAALAGGITGTFNLGTGAGTSVTELYALLCEASGSTIATEYGPARPGEIRDSALDASAARAALGWAPQVELAEGLRRTWAWVMSGAL